jgi:hypothetical protein
VATEGHHDGQKERMNELITDQVEVLDGRRAQHQDDHHHATSDGGRSGQRAATRKVGTIDLVNSPISWA